jgi:hypothetical protein
VNARSRSASAGPADAGARRAPPAPPALALHGGPIGPAGDRRWTLAAYAVAALLAAALLAMVLGPHRVGDYFTETDFYGAYAEGARLVQHGRLDPTRYGVIGPGYEIALAVAGFVVRDLLLAAELLSVLSAVAIVLFWFHLVRRRVDALAGALAALFIASNAWLFRFGYSAATDAFAIALQAAAAWLLLGRDGDRPRAVALAGVVAALAFLTRYNAVYLLPAALAAVLAGGTGTPRRGRDALLFAGGFLAPVVPWVLYSLGHGGAFSFQLHHNIAYEVFARSKGIAWDDYQKTLQSQFPNLASVIARDPGAVFGRMLFNLGDHLRLDAARLLGWPLAACAATGLAFSTRDGSLRRLWPVVVAGALLFLTLVPVFHAERYSLALLPVHATLGAIAFSSPIAALAVAGGRVWLKPLLAVVPLAFAVSASWRLQTRTIDQLPVEVLDAGATLRELARPGDRVIARKGHIGYHGGVEAIGFPFADSLGQLAEYARRSRARWLYFSWPEAETRPQFFHLLDTAGVVPGLTPRRVTRPHPAVLYEIGGDFGRTPAWWASDTLRAWHDLRARLLVDASQTDLLYRYGGLSWTMGRLPQAREALEQAARQDPRRVEIPLLLGRVLIEMGQDPLAERAFARAEELAPDHPEARIGRGLAVDLQGRPQEAAELWRPVIRHTGNPRVLERMIAIYDGLGDAAAAAEARATLARLQGAR